MKSRSLSLLSALLLLACAGLTSCNKQPSGSSSMFSSSTRAADSAANDYTKPYLTDDKMGKFLSSMKEEHNPFELIFKKGGQMQNPIDLASRMEEFNSFARRYGFQDYQDYTAVWGRILTGEMQLWAADMKTESAKSFEKIISDAQADLKKPNLTPDQRKMDEEQIANAQKTVDDLNKSDSSSGLNDADLTLVKKYKDQIDAAEKKYKTNQ